MSQKAAAGPRSQTAARLVVDAHQFGQLFLDLLMFLAVQDEQEVRALHQAIVQLLELFLVKVSSSHVTLLKLLDHFMCYVQALTGEIIVES